MASGLSRRRVGAAANGNEDIERVGSPGENAPSAPSASKGHAGPNDAESTRVQYAGTAMEGGHRVAYDPRDLMEQEQDGGKLPLLTLLEEVLLLGLKDKQGYLSFWNDNISYALRGLILLELSLRKRIAMVKDSARKRYPLPDRFIEVIDDRQTGETLLDEALKLIKTSESMGVGSWIDLMSGETWNVMKIGYQLKQVRERIAKGLVDKGILRTEKKNFFLFDMATHPLADTGVRHKEEINNRVISLLSSTAAAIPDQALHRLGINHRVTRAVCLICGAYAANVLENPLGRLTYEDREVCLARADDVLASFSCWPFGANAGVAGGRRPASSVRIAAGNGGSSNEVSSLAELVHSVRAEMSQPVDGDDLSFEVVAAVLEVFSKMDSLL